MTGQRRASTAARQAKPGLEVNVSGVLAPSRPGTGQNVADKRQTGTHTQLRARLARHSLFTIRPISNSGSGSAQDFGFGFDTTREQVPTRATIYRPCAQPTNSPQPARVRPTDPTDRPSDRPTP
ncbi:hypothetical protein FJTKL_06717 [Diaporthe vaccinii]|uniref:Uncharacterized protein n=1 Tax=Diaporthe vaccinii TaxID=105482 RepID=A0ABR4EWS0_9PEZI